MIGKILNAVRSGFNWGDRNANRTVTRRYLAVPTPGDAAPAKLSLVEDKQNVVPLPTGNREQRVIGLISAEYPLRVCITGSRKCDSERMAK